MTRTVTDLAGKRVLVLGDNAKLSRAIELNLELCLRMQIMIRMTSSPSQRKDRTENNPQHNDASDNGARNVDLIVVAASSPTSEPIIALARASLTGCIGQVPILIISHRPIDPAPDAHIDHLNFPFDANGLYKKVRDILA
ncbi:MAG: hypothetical protein GY832_13470 [Chloroflexi bacterium]|nr:hypothetical protein [Chloroflexota bacterium]